jgi:hypothetical protein
MTRSRFSLLLSLVTFASGVSQASGTVIDFNSLSPGVISGGILTIVADGVSVTFSAAPNNLRVLNLNAPFNQRVLTTEGFVDPITVTFGGGFTSNYVEVTNHINGSLTSEIDVIVGSAYSASNGLLDSQTNSNAIHHLSGPGIAKVVYDDGTYNGGATAFTIDNFTFGETIPEPTGGILFGLATVCLGIGRRFA